MFETPVKNRRMTTWEREQEIMDSIIWHRVPRDYILDKPTYPWIKPDYTQMVNFDLNKPKYGI